MKNKISDVRDFLVQALEDLSDTTVDADTMARTIDRAKAISTVASTYTQSVKVEVDARRLYAEHGERAMGKMDVLLLLPKGGDTP